MFVKNHTLLKFLSAMFLTAVGATSVLAGDALKTSDADHSSLTEADKIYEESLLENNKNYPTVELRKSASNDCYCEGGYFGFSAGYAHAPSKSLIRIIPIVNLNTYTKQPFFISSKQSNPSTYTKQPFF